MSAPVVDAASSAAVSISSSSYVVHKFGGTSLAASECYANSAEIIRSIPREENHDPALVSEDVTVAQRTCVVVSAMGEVKGEGSLVGKLIRSRSPLKAFTRLDKVTNYLIQCTALAAQNDEAYLKLLAQLKQRHLDVVNELLGSDSDGADLLSSVLSALERDFSDLSHILRAVWLSRTYDPDHNWWFGFGEIWSARLMAAYLNLLDQRARAANPAAPRQDAIFVDARELIQLAPHKEPTPDYDASRKKIDAWLASSEAARTSRIVVVTGYIAVTSTGTPTTLGRDGSDYSASILASLLRARSVTIWTDVDGVYSANPGQVREAVILPEMSYDEASELAYFGAKVLHPKTMTPLVRAAIPVWIRNTFNPSHPGSYIAGGEEIHTRDRAASAAARAAAAAAGLKKSPSSESVVGYGVRGFSEISRLCLLIVEGTGMIGVPGVCARLFGALRQAGVSVVLITQAGSEHSICLCLPAAHGRIGLEAIRREFRDELESHEVQTVDLREGVACLAIVGDGMRSRRGAAARMFAALADAGINIVAIAQGSSERNISVIISELDVTRGLIAVHQAFLANEHGKEYSPLLTPSASPPIDESAEPPAFALPLPVSTTNTASVQPVDASLESSFAALGITSAIPRLDCLFPLPLESTLLGLSKRGARVTRVDVFLPRRLASEVANAVSVSDVHVRASWTTAEATSEPAAAPEALKDDETAATIHIAGQQRPLQIRATVM